MPVPTRATVATHLIFLNHRETTTFPKGFAVFQKKSTFSHFHVDLCDLRRFVGHCSLWQCCLACFLIPGVVTAGELGDLWHASLSAAFPYQLSLMHGRSGQGRQEAHDTFLR